VCVYPIGVVDQNGEEKGVQSAKSSDHRLDAALDAPDALT
jgi:hypothetical protein